MKNSLKNLFANKNLNELSQDEMTNTRGGWKTEWETANSKYNQDPKNDNYGNYGNIEDEGSGGLFSFFSKRK